MDRVNDSNAQKWWGSNIVDIAALRNNQWIDWAQDWGTDNPTGWWQDIPQYATYDRQKQTGVGYDPTDHGMSYDPSTSGSSKYISGILDSWIFSDENAYLHDFGGVHGGYGDVGKVAQDPTYGQFAQDLNVYQEIQNAANKYGVPANFLQVILNREGSGDWPTNNAKGSFFISSRNDVLTPYTGVFKAAADQRVGPGIYERSIGNRALQIEILAGVLRSQYDELQKKNPQWGWTNVAAYHYSGDPTGASTPGDSTQYYQTSDYVAQTERDWKMLDAKAGNKWANFTTTTPTTTGGGAMGAPSTQKWSMVNQWDNQINAAIARVQQETGVAVPGNVVKAIMQIESGGDPNVGVSPAGYGGLMQTGPGSMGGPWSMSQLQDPAFAIYTGVKELGLRYLDSGRLPWSNVIVGYFSGHYYPNGASDGYNSDYNYQTMFNANMAELGAAGSGVYGGNGAPVNATPGTNYMAAIFGGTEHPLTQEFGATEWSMGDGAWMYEYSFKLGFTVSSHPGLDIQADLHTTVYFPFDGVVEYVGPDGGFRDTISGGVGQIRVRLSNGDSVIYGHMYSSNFAAGQTIKAGSAIGMTGGMNGPHLHLEYRTPDASTEAGERAIDPRGPFHGDFTGSYTNGGPTGPATPYVPVGPQSWQEALKWAAMGKSLEGYGATASGAGQWNAILRASATGSKVADVMLGKTPTAYTGGVANTSTQPLAGDQKKIVDYAKGYVGSPYVYATSGPTTFDCSGFTYWVYKNAWGIDISTGSHYQFTQGKAVDLSQLQAGDLLFYDTSGGTEYDNGNYASHVSMYIGNGQVIHAANPSQGVITSDVTDYFGGTFLGARRYV